MIKNKHIQRLAIILTCAGLIGNLLAPEADKGRITEYSLQLRGMNGDIEHERFILTAQDIDVIRDKNHHEQFIELLNMRFNSGTVAHGAKFYQFYVDRLTYEAEKIIVPTVVYKSTGRFFVEKGKGRIYISDSRLRDKVYIHTENQALKSGYYYRFLDLSDALKGNKSLFLGDDGLKFQVHFTNYTDLVELCDSIYFLQQLADSRNESINHTFYFLQDLRQHPNAYSFTKHYGNEYVLTFIKSKYLDLFANALYEFILTDESEKSNLHQHNDPEIGELYNLSLPEGSEMTLKSIKLANREYHFRNKCRLKDISTIIFIQQKLYTQIIHKFGRPGCRSLPELKVAWENFNLEQLFEPIDAICRELNEKRLVSL